jgi:hypothetical protein
MTKYTARISRILQHGIHKIGRVTADGRLTAGDPLPVPDRVEIRLETGADGPCLMVRYTDSGRFCGDTWHKSLGDAFAQAAFEYGLCEADFSVERD